MGIDLISRIVRSLCRERSRLEQEQVRNKQSFLGGGKKVLAASEGLDRWFGSRRGGLSSGMMKGK